MRILHTCLRYPPATGGVETYVQQLVKRTSWIEQEAAEPDNKTAFDVRVLTSKLRTHGPISELNPELLLDDPAYVQRLHHLATPALAYPRLQALKYYIGHHQPGIIHGHSFWYQPADVAARYAKANNIPFLFHPYYYENEVRQKPIWQLYKNTIGKKTFAAADIVAVISPFEQQLIEQAGFSVKRFELLPPGIDVEKFTTPKINPYVKHGLSGNILLSVNRISPGKGLDEVISILPEIIREYPETHYVIIGEDFGAKAALEKQAEALGIANHIHFIGRVSDDDLLAWYQHADIFVHPSHYEAFGIVLGESLAASTPIIARNATAIPFVVPHNIGGLLFSNSQEMILHLKTLLGNSTLREKLGRDGRQHIEQNFTWDKTMKKLLELYREFKQLDGAAS